MRLSLSISCALLSAALLAGCNEDTPPQVQSPSQTQAKPKAPYKADGVTYTSVEAAIVGHRVIIERELSVIQPPGKPVGGSLLLIQPSISRLKYMTATVLHRHDDITDYIANVFDIDMHVAARAMVQVKEFDKVEVVTSDEPDKVDAAGYDYKMWTELAEDGHNRTYLIVPSKPENKIEIIFGTSQSNLERLRNIMASTLNGASDLGAKVDRVTIPGVTGGTTSGTGFFINKDGNLLTNAHVVNGCRKLKVVLPQEEADASLVKSDSRNDLALLRVPSRTAGPIAQFHGYSPVRMGDEAVAYGFPLAGALSSQGNLTNGNVTALSGLADDSRFYQISTQIQPGNSGGPLLSEDGRVIGITSSFITYSMQSPGQASVNVAQNLNFAIKAQIAMNFLDTNSVKYELATTAHPAMKLADIGDLAKGYTFMVKCIK